jgi:predicted lipoprotein with Yx(FWY)xxD motif
MTQFIRLVAAIIVVVVVLYGGYRLYHHYTYQQPGAPVAVVPTNNPVASSSASPTSSSSASPTSSPTGSPEAVQNGVYKMMSDSNGVSYLTDENGMTLYIYSKDTTGVSNCSGTCITNWPEFGPKIEPTSLPANITVITRSDKSLQYAWKGMPLYYFVKDTKAGDVTGDGVGDFTIAR